jgi:TRAP-type C4-dicarboxylate transport system permease small subunit
MSPLDAAVGKAMRSTFGCIFLLIASGMSCYGLYQIWQWLDESTHSLILAIAKPLGYVVAILICTFIGAVLLSPEDSGNQGQDQNGGGE